jgi:ribosomal protein L2
LSNVDKPKHPKTKSGEERYKMARAHMKVAITNGSKLNQHPFGGTSTRIGQQNWFSFG